MFNGLPVAGWSGTLADRFVDAQPPNGRSGVVLGKTGTLSGVNALSGELVTADGRLLLFAIMADGSGQRTRDAARAALDQIAAKLATCGCPDRAGCAGCAGVPPRVRWVAWRSSSTGIWPPPPRARSS